MPVSLEELRVIIGKSPSKACSLDPMPTWLVKDVLDELLPLMVDIVNTSMATGMVPDAMKVAVVTPLLKKQTLDPEELEELPPCQ